MADRKLAFQRWEPGQVLEPQHFRADEDAVVAHARLLGELRGLPLYGMGRVAWSDTAFRLGSVSVSALTAIFPSGVVVDVPGNATIADLDLKTIKGATITLYLHLVKKQTESHYDDDDKVVTRVYHQLQLSTEPTLNDARDVLPFAVVVVDPLSKSHALGRDSSPPLLQIGNNPFLRPQLTELKELLVEIERIINAELEDPMFRGERLASARGCETASVRLRTTLEEHLDTTPSGIHRHPYLLFDAIRSFYLELTALREAAPQIRRYTHDDLAGCFNRLIDGIRALAGSEPIKSPRLIFQREADDQPFVARPFPAEVRKADEAYLVVQLGEDGKKGKLSGIKLASPRKIVDVERLSLPGITFHSIASPPPFRHSFGADVEFYRITNSGDEWKRAVDEGALCYRGTAAQRHLRVALYWRNA
jgi:type VI secretion system protein ImpJ